MGWTSEPTRALSGADRPTGSWLAVVVAVLVLAFVALVISVASAPPAAPPPATVGGAADIG